ncbi:MAG TPA: FtsW/RodA/SpoVE family cell cycle protein, partial [Chthonomonadales bacterium]|nr:FtsW/RodA/SpoVE family cell cycle protein [Chthonomonadales bacterium]
IRHLAALVAIGGALFAAFWFSGRFIRSYQKQRLIAFVHPEADPKESGYHVIQARIAIGSGGLWGKGLFHSTQVRGGYIPERQTDFIFTDIGEELGFTGAATIALLYAGMLWRGWNIIALSDEDRLGKLIATGIVTMLAFHIVLNIGMNIGILPVAGVPLPLISSGGSNVILTLTCIGLLESVCIRRHRLQF